MALDSQAAVILSTVMAVMMAIAVMFIRIKASEKPATAKKIILPPFFMSTGALMFLHPMFQVTFLEVVEAFSVGLLFSILLIKTSKFEIRGNHIYLKRSKAFVFILIGLLIIRIILKTYLSQSIDIGELGGMFWILAFGMIVPWRIAMYISYRKMEEKLEPPNIHAT
ncbi:CcdC family protein [Metabacillus arenae]|uniref:Cytochrome c biogenesis protein CcdC n=1 Tax=Metabacillus arenae TaxID=2771434 RepID=A0A926NK47_9BACI|nr:cytochrome c biogenesis protein CcdC [Metabacillus arenae]MBD1379326.1 cytochrome c biogenesis protein CcdC [Metabacillus arenae]